MLNTRGAPDWASRLTARWSMLISVLCGIAIGLGQAPFDLPFLSIVAWPILFWQLELTSSPRRAFWLGIMAGTAQFAVVLSWIVEPFLVDVARHGWMAPFALILMSAGLSLFWAFAFAGARAVRTRFARLLMLAALLALLEWTRAWIFTGFPWAMLSHAWVEYPVAQIAAYIGPHGLSLITLLICLLPALGWRGAGAAGAALAIVWVVGADRLSDAMPTRTQPLQVRIVQPNAAQHLKWQPDMLPVFYERLIRLTETPTAISPDVVIWPETAAAFLLGERQDLLDDMATAANAPLIFGVRKREGWGQWFNSVAVLERDGTISASHDKDHLVPFGEYIPFNDFFARLGIGGLAVGNAGGFTAGTDSRLLQPQSLPDFLVLICYEAIFPTELRTAIRPEWLVLVTNDAWFGEWTGPYQHLAQGRFRAIEQGLPMARAANTGISAMIDARGTVLQSIPLGMDGHLDAALPAALPETLYVRFGNMLFLILGGILIAGSLIIHRISRQ